MNPHPKNGPAMTNFDPDERFTLPDNEVLRRLLESDGTEEVSDKAEDTEQPDT